MQVTQFIQRNEDGLDEVRVSDVDSIEAPFYTPEIKGPEGLQALLHTREGLDENNPIMVCGHRWQDIRSKPRFKQVREEIYKLTREHPIYYYEPVELLRYTQPQNLVTHAFQGDQGRSGSFYDDLRDGNYQDAIDRLPEFFQPFIEEQMKPLLRSKDIRVPPKYKSNSSGKVWQAWRDSRADSGFTPYFERLADDAANSPNAAVIPPTPPVMKSTGQDVISRTIGLNRYMRNLCEKKWEDPSSGDLTEYLHFYIDQGVFDPSSENDELVKGAIQEEIRESNYAGVALTISNPENIWKKGQEKAFERFITDLSSIAREEHLPLILPRSGYYGLHLTDHGVQSFSSLMNGNLSYSRRGGGMDQVAKYGTTPIYGAAKDVNAEALDQVLSRNGGQVHSIPNLPDSPPTYNRGASSVNSKFGQANEFRIKFGKQRRLLHVQKARELRDDIRRGTADPARRYLERGDHPHLS